MAEQYSHTLIARDKDYVPSPAAVHKFLDGMVAEGVVPSPATIQMRMRSGKTRQYPNPFTGGTVTVEVKDQKRLRSLDAFERSVAGKSDYEVVVSGEGRPRRPPVPVEFDGPYFVAVTCYVSSILRITSDSHQEAIGDPLVGSYEQPFDAPDLTGRFRDARTGRIIEVPEAGAARFWVEFELGKFLFPEFRGIDLAILNPEVVADAERCFQTRFVQGCRWG